MKPPHRAEATLYSVYEGRLTEALDLSFAVFRGFYVTRPPEERGIVRRIFIRSLQNLEMDELRLKQKELEKPETDFVRYAEQLRYDKTNECDYQAKKSRYIYHEEKRIMLESTGNLPSVGLRARVDVDRFCIDKWLQHLFNSNNFEIEKTIAAEAFCKNPEELKLYQKIQKKLKSFPNYVIHPLQMPSLFTSEGQKELYMSLLERKKALVRQRLDEQRQLILGNGDDFGIIHSNLGSGGLGGNRSPYSTFTAKALEHLKVAAQNIMTTHGLRLGQFQVARQKLLNLTEEARLILMMNGFVDIYGHFQVLRKSLENFRATFIKQGAKLQEVEPPALRVDELIKKRLEEIKTICLEKLQKPLELGAKIRQLKRDELIVLHTFVEAFFSQLHLACFFLNDLIAIIEVRQVADFTEDQRRAATALPQRAGSNSALNAKSDKRTGSVILVPNAIDKLLSRDSTEMRISPSESPVQTVSRVDENIKIEDYKLMTASLEFFKILRELLEKIDNTNLKSQ